MHIRPLGSLVLVSTLAAVSAATFAGFTMMPAPAAPATGSSALDGELHEHMLAVRDNTRTLLRAAADPATQADALKAVAEIQKHVVEAKTLAPTSAESVSEADRPAYVLDFRKGLTEVLRELAEIELAIIANQNDDAVKRIRENLIKMRDAAHEKFKVDG